MNAIQSGCFAVLVLGLAAGCADSPLGSAPDGDARRAASEALSASVGGSGNGGHIDMLDDCDPADLGWNRTGGCRLRHGDATEAEFLALLGSPLSTGVVGHPAWRNEPSYLKVVEGHPVLVRNRGGRLHTLTPVAAFGGGRIPPLRAGLTPAPECLLAPGAADPFAVAAGDHLTLTGLGVGIHRLQCCLHPWMRELIRVTAAGGT